MVRRLILLNGFAILGVILFHASGWGFTALFAWRSQWETAASAGFEPMGSLSYFALRIIEQLVVASIPAFLFVSGYFVAVAAGRTQVTVGWTVIGSRVKHLLIPYLIWSAGVLMLEAAQGHVFSAGEYLGILLTGTANPAYYYVLLLSQFYLISPFLVPMVRKHPVLVLVGAAVVQVSIQLLQYPLFLNVHLPGLEPFVDRVPRWVFAVRIFWFSFGMVAGFHLAQVKLWAARLRPFLPSVLLFCLVVGVVEWEYYFSVSGQEWLNVRETLLDTVFSLAVLLAFVAFDKLPISGSKHLEYCGIRSFGIYLAHSPVMEYASRAVYHLAPGLLVYQIAMQPLLIAVGLAVPLIAMAVVERSPVRRLYPYLFG